MIIRTLVYVLVATAAFLLLSCHLKSQSTKVTVYRDYDYPTPPKVTIPEIVIHPKNLFKTPDSLTSFKDYSYVNFYADYVLPNDPYLTPFYRQGNNFKPRSLLVKYLQENSIALVIDGDGDGNFDEEKIDTISTDHPEMIEREFVLINDNKNCPVTLPLRVETKFNGSTFQEMRIKNLLTYRLRYSWGVDTFSIDIYTHLQYIWCYMHSGEPKDTLSIFRLNEPFRFKEKYYKLSNLDLCANSVTLERLTGSKVIGYNEGHHIDMPLFRQLTDQNLMLKGSDLNYKSKPYLLLHFWGEWCGPCRAETETVKALDAHLEAGEKVQMVHYPWVFEKKLLQRTLDYIDQHGLSTRQSYCFGEGCSSDDAIKEQCHVATLLRVSNYPCYILINSDGKVILRNDRGDANDVVLKLKKLGLY
jgi:thiol-disulfide isomerase/thioredoxin